MKIKGTIFSIEPETREVEVEHDGEIVKASVSELGIQILLKAGTTLKMNTKDAEGMVPGDVVEITITKGE